MTLEELEAEVALLRTQVPTLEDQLFSTTIPCWRASGVPTSKITSGTMVTLMVAPIPLRILSVVFSFEYWNLTASDSNYWQARLARGSTTAFTTFATKTTQINGANANGGIVARKAWPMDSAAWGSADLAASDLLAFIATPFGDPASDWDLPMTATIRYRPL